MSVFDIKAMCVTVDVQYFYQTLSSDGSQPSTFHKVEIWSWAILPFLVLCTYIELFYLNSIEQLGNLVGLKEQLEVCLTCWRLLAAIQMLLLHQKLRCSNNKMTLPNDGNLVNYEVSPSAHIRHFFTGAF